MAGSIPPPGPNPYAIADAMARADPASVLYPDVSPPLHPDAFTGSPDDPTMFGQAMRDAAEAVVATP